MPSLVPPVAGEREGLLGYLAQQRDVLKIAAYGLTDDQVLQRPRNRSVEDYESGLRLESNEMSASALGRYDEAATRTEAVVGGIADLRQAIPVSRGVPWYPQDIEAWSVRWVLLHLIEETARHAGHADIIREPIDCATAYQLMGQFARGNEEP